MKMDLSERSMTYLLQSFIFLVMTSSIESFPSYKRLIPNRNKVQHPCIPFFKWPAVGHTNPFGGGARNPFGDDFANAGYEWTVDLCNLDSDGDGKTNGEELGDPDCVWQVGQTPSRTTRITHPGYRQWDFFGCFSPTRYAPGKAKLKL